jgi:transposase
MHNIHVRDGVSEYLCANARSRDRLVGERTSLANQIRSLLLERGHIVAQGYAQLRLLLSELLDCGSGALSPRMTFLLGDMRTRWEELDRRVAAFDAEFAAMARTDDRARRLTGIPGIGALNATAPVAAVGSAATFDKGRDLAAWLGLVPRQATTGGRPKLLHFSPAPIPRSPSSLWPRRWRAPSGRCSATNGLIRPYP